MIAALIIENYLFIITIICIGNFSEYHIPRSCNCSAIRRLPALEGLVCRNSVVSSLETVRFLEESVRRSFTVNLRCIEDSISQRLCLFK